MCVKCSHDSLEAMYIMFSTGHILRVTSGTLIGVFGKPYNSASVLKPGRRKAVGLLLLRLGSR